MRRAIRCTRPGLVWAGVDGVMVNVTGRPVDVCVNFVAGVAHAHYSGSAENGSTTGTFTGLGATNPQPLTAAPALGAPGHL